jgi:hypothetical protein
MTQGQGRPGTLGPLERRRSQLASDAALTVATQHVVATATIHGSGEVQITVPFPLLFIDMPVFSFGSIMADNSNITQGVYPSVTATVHRWTTTKIALATYWVGAVVGVVSTGPAEQQFTAHLHFVGKGLRGPTGSTTSTTAGTL